MASPPGRSDDGETALLLSPPFDEAGRAACFDHLTDGERLPQKVLNVLFTRRPEHRIENWRHHVGEPPETFVLLTSQAPAERHGDATIETLAEPGDLTATGVAITKHLSEWSTDERTAFCLDSATAQLQYADRETVYQFLHTLRSHLAARGTVGHVHLNPDAHPDRTVDTFRTLFDTVVEADDEDPTITSRRGGQ